MNSSDHSGRRQSEKLHASPLPSDIIRFIRTALIVLTLSGGCATTMPARSSSVPVQAPEQSSPDDDDKNDDEDVYGADFPCGLKHPDGKGACPLVQKMDKNGESKVVAANEKGMGHVF